MSHRSMMWSEEDCTFGKAMPHFMMSSAVGTWISVGGLIQRRCGAQNNERTRVLSGNAKADDILFAINRHLFYKPVSSLRPACEEVVPGGWTVVGHTIFRALKRTAKRDQLRIINSGLRYVYRCEKKTRHPLTASEPPYTQDQFVKTERSQQHTDGIGNYNSGN